MRLRTCLALVAVLILGLYLLNPLGPDSLDPRARLAGFLPYRLPANSMAPTLRKDDFILVSAWAYAWDEPQRGDVMVFQHPRIAQTAYVKRLIGLPGERVAMVNGHILIDGKPLNEPYLNPDQSNAHHDSLEMAPRTVPAGKLFMLGDNRHNSNDSRYWGMVPRANVIGRVQRIWWAEDSQRIGDVH
ncbi:MAG: signal peptidase I [Pseudomonadota bacterium]